MQTINFHTLYSQAQSQNSQ